MWDKVLEKTPGSSIFATRQATLTGGYFSQTLVGLPDNPNNLSESEVYVLNKRQMLDGVSIEFYADDVRPDELPKIIVVENIGLPNDDFDRRGC